MRVAISKAEIESELASRFGAALKPRAKTIADVISTGIPEINVLTGGFPRGAITEIFGPASSGRTSLLLSTLAHATSHQEVCALVDINDVFDPTAAPAAGLVLDQLLWIRCATRLEQAFKATDLLLQAGGFGLVVLDLGDVAGKDARRIISSWWYRFRRTVENTPTALVVIAEDMCVRSCASLTLELKREADLWSSLNQQLLNSSYGIPVREPSFSPTQQLSKSSTHANLLLGMQFQGERLKPVHLGVRQVQFAVRVVP